MKLPKTAHTSRPWRVHEITKDFELEDVWELPTPGGRRPRATSAVVRRLLACTKRWAAPVETTCAGRSSMRSDRLRFRLAASSARSAGRSPR